MSSKTDSSVFSGSRDAAVMEAILKEMGIEDYEPNVIHQMLEFSYSKKIVLSRSVSALVYSIGYVTNVLEDARIYSEHAQKKELDISDVKLAVQTRMDHSFTTPPPRDVKHQKSLMQLAINFLILVLDRNSTEEKYFFSSTNSRKIWSSSSP